MTKFKVNEYVLYKKDICIIKDIKINKMNNKEYYILELVEDKSLTIDVPTDNKMGYLKKIISQEEANNLINNIPNINIIENIDDKNIEKIYKELLNRGNHDDLVKIIKTTYLRNENRKNNNKKISEKDLNYFKQAEKYLYNELAVCFKMDFNECKDYIINKVKELV